MTGPRTIRMPSKSQKEKDAQYLASLMQQGRSYAFYVFPSGGMQSIIDGSDDERWPGPGESYIRVRDGRGRNMDDLVEEAREILNGARAAGQKALRTQLKVARAQGEYDRARYLARHVYRSGGRLIDAIDRQEQAAKARSGG